MKRAKGLMAYSADTTTTTTTTTTTINYDKTQNCSEGSYSCQCN